MLVKMLVNFYRTYFLFKKKQGDMKMIDFESGTTYSENPAYGWVFAFLGMEIRSPHLWPD
ncbi:hypothetical protein CI424_19565 [Salmonella enterica subsp. enterica serovar Enteritidis]|nr:hypothetical protein [Salmonella enterica subsp. enterica serovar Wandsworth]EDK5263363.1 hypothetical protein [Salmonella enterica subsp. enterica serovar Enteritidis]